MKKCWPDGDLRAYIDGELASDAREAVAAHVEACSACVARYRELAERAEWVSAVMALSESTPRTSTPRTSTPRPRPRRWMAVLPLAAALAIGFVMLPKRAPVRMALAAKVVAPPPAAPAPPAEEFLRLDDDPIETATIVRISADNGGVQADLIIGPDGRAHAIRVVANQ
jgi:hypothetical protein